MTSDSLHQALSRAAATAAATADAINDALRRAAADNPLGAVFCAELLQDAAKLRDRIGHAARVTEPPEQGS